MAPGISDNKRLISGLKSVYIASSILLYTLNLTARTFRVLRMADNHLQFCDGKDWVQILDKKLNQNSQGTPGLWVCSLPVVASLVQLATNLLSFLKSNINRFVL